MGPAGALARRLARTAYGRRVLGAEPDLDAFRRRPSPRLSLGLALIALSFALGGLTAVAGGYLLLEGERSWLLLVGAGAVVVLVHLVFAAGVWLAGANHAAVLLHWAARRFLLRWG